MIPLIFLLISTAFIVTLLRSVFSLLGHSWEEDGNNAKTLILMFKWPIIMFILFIVFIAVGIPFIESSTGL